MCTTNGSFLLYLLECPRDVPEDHVLPEYTCLNERPLGADAIRQRPEQQLLHVRQPYRAGRLHRDLRAGLHSVQCAETRGMMVWAAAAT